MLWSSGTRLGDPPPAWVLNFYDGGSGYQNKGMEAFVLSVRLGSDKGRNDMRAGGGWSVWGAPEFATQVKPRKSVVARRFVDHGDGTVSDQTTRLMWQKEDDGKRKNWFEAEKFAETLSLAGHSDWRVPTLEELASLWETAGSNNATRTTCFPGTAPFGYWSSTSRTNYKAWYIGFKDGLVNYLGQGNHEFYTRCVRSLQMEPCETSDTHPPHPEQSLADAYNIRGNASYDEGNYEAAIVNFTKALDINPQFASAYINRGVAYAAQENYTLAIADYNSALTINPQLAEAYNNRGNAYRNQGEFEPAITDYNLALQINPKFAEAYCNRGIAYDEQGKSELAMTDFGLALNLNPKDPEAYYERGVAYFKKRDYRSARKDWEKAVELDPEGHNGQKARHNLQVLGNKGY